MGRTCLVEMNHLVVLHLIPSIIETLRLLFAVSDDMTEERHPLVALPNPEGKIHGSHIVQFTRTASTEQQRENTQQICHDAAKIRYFIEN